MFSVDFLAEICLSPDAVRVLAFGNLESFEVTIVDTSGTIRRAEDSILLGGDGQLVEPYSKIQIVPHTEVTLMELGVEVAPGVVTVMVLLDRNGNEVERTVSGTL